ncbi:MAG TPA: YihY/virulence factor BrkB family protein [Gemmatimonadaceae bacterium]|nr:YihY/virulence factor BrkB family protein [Gemmatimonadaceae bacterium]
MTLFEEAAAAGRALRDDVRVIAAQFGRQDIFFHAGSVAYSALLAGVPFALLLASAIGYLLGAAQPVSYDFLERFLGQLLPDRTAAAAIPIIKGILDDVQASRGKAGLVGLPLFIWFSTRFFGALRASLGSVFAVDRGRSFVHGKLLDAVYVTAGTVFATIYLALQVYLARGTTVGLAVLHTINVQAGTVSFLSFFVARLLATTFLAAMFTGLYKFLPNRRIHWESAAWGGIWGAALFEITRNVIFEVVTRLWNPASLYSGTLAVVVVVVFWAYYAAVVFLIGGVVARVHEIRATRKTKRKE